MSPASFYGADDDDEDFAVAQHQLMDGKNEKKIAFLPRHESLPSAEHFTKKKRKSFAMQWIDPESGSIKRKRRAIYFYTKRKNNIQSVVKIGNCCSGGGGIAFSLV